MSELNKEILETTKLSPNANSSSLLQQQSMEKEQQKELGQLATTDTDQTLNIQPGYQLKLTVFQLANQYVSTTYIEPLTNSISHPAQQNNSLPSSDGESSKNSPESHRHDISHLYDAQNARNRDWRNNYRRRMSRYWTKILLIFFKRPHFMFIAEMKGKDFLYLEENHHLLEIFLTKYMTLQDYKVLYMDEKLQEVWKQLFRIKRLHRYLMLSKIRGQQKEIFLKFLGNFQRMFKTKEFARLFRDPRFADA